jgi:hypothetical protein
MTSKEAMVPTEEMLLITERNLPRIEESAISAISENQFTVIIDPKREIREYMIMRLTGSSAKGIKTHKKARIMLPEKRNIFLDPVLSLIFPQSSCPPFVMAFALDCNQPISDALAPRSTP